MLIYINETNYRIRIYLKKQFWWLLVKIFFEKYTCISFKIYIILYINIGHFNCYVCSEDNP